MKDADGRQRRVNYVADESGFHANVETNEHGTKSSSPADAQILATPANPEQLIYHQQSTGVDHSQHHAHHQQLVAGQQVVRQQQVQYGSQYQQPGYAYGNSYGVAYPGSQATYGYSYLPASSYYGGVSNYPGYYQQSAGYYPSTSSNYYGYNYAAPAYGGYAANYGVGDGSVYGGYNYHTPSSYFSAVRQSAVKPTVSYVNRQVSSSVVPISTSSSSLTGSSNYAIIQKRDVEATKPAEASKQEKASPEKPGQEKKTN